MATVDELLEPENARFRTSGQPALVEIHGSDGPVAALGFLNGVDQTAEWRFMARAYGSGSVWAEVYWYPATASGGTIVLEGTIKALTPNADNVDTETKAYGSPTTVSDAHLGSTNKRPHSCLIEVTSPDGVAAGDQAWFRLRRLGATGVGDNLSGLALVERVVLFYSDT